MEKLFSLAMVYIARWAVAVAAEVGAVGACVLARLLYGTLYAEALHIFVGGNLRVDVVALENLCQRHTQKEESNQENRYSNND